MDELLNAISSQLELSPPAAPPTLPGHAPLRLQVAEELSMLGVILVKKSAGEVMSFSVEAVKRLTEILTQCGNMDPSASCTITVCAYSCLVALLSARRKALATQLTSDNGEPQPSPSLSH